MAFPTSVNSQITDAVTQTSTQVLGSASTFAMGALYQATAQAMANAAHNATHAQQQGYIVAQAATVLAAARLHRLAGQGLAPGELLTGLVQDPSPPPAATASAAFAEAETAIAILKAFAQDDAPEAAESKALLDQLAASLAPAT